MTPVSTKQAELVAKFAASVVDTGGNFATGVIDTGGKFAFNSSVIFLPVLKSPTQIGFDGIINLETEFSCLGPFKYSLWGRVKYTN